MMTQPQEWTPCAQPEVHDTLRWKEPLWAAPNKPRGKRDKIGEQEITAKLTAMHEVLELTVIRVEKLDAGDAPLQVKEHDMIRRKRSSLKQGECCKLMG